MRCIYRSSQSGFPCFQRVFHPKVSPTNSDLVKLQISKRKGRTHKSFANSATAGNFPWKKEWKRISKREKKKFEMIGKFSESLFSIGVLRERE